MITSVNHLHKICSADLLELAKGRQHYCNFLCGLLRLLLQLKELIIYGIWCFDLRTSNFFFSTQTGNKQSRYHRDSSAINCCKLNQALGISDESDFRDEISIDEPTMIAITSVFICFDRYDPELFMVLTKFPCRTFTIPLAELVTTWTHHNGKHVQHTNRC